MDLRLVVEYIGLGYSEVDGLPRKTDALIYRWTLGGTTAFVNKNTPEPISRFTLAHGLCHYLHHGEPDVFEGHVIPGKPTRIRFPGGHAAREREADIFAYELLIPKYLLRKQPAHLTYDEIARRFVVSRSVAIEAVRIPLCT